MDAQKREQIALFRFGVITPLVGRKGLGWGEREKILGQITATTWEIPGSGRTTVSRSTVLKWLSRYERSGRAVESLKPHERGDKGKGRVLDPESELSLVNLRRQLPEVSVPVLLKEARRRNILGYEEVSIQSIYRIFKRHGLDRQSTSPEDRRRFETELPNDLWQSDCLHGPRVVDVGRLRKSYLFAFIDDHSRLIPHAQFYLSENTDSFRDCLLHALQTRGLPRKLYVDNGAVFRTHRLKYACARLGISLLHSTPYTPEGRGKIERFFKTLRTQLLPLLQEPLSLSQLNDRLRHWLDTDYHQRPHSSTGKSPLQRFLDHIALVRPAPKDLPDYFRIPVRRKVDKDRTVSLNGRMYEAPLGLVGQSVTLLYHERDPQRIEVFFQEHSCGFLTPLDLHVNARIRRISGQVTEMIPSKDPPPPTNTPYRGGSLFERRDQK